MHQDLSPREREVAALVAAGRTNNQIALELVLANATVKGHLESIFRKTGATSRTGVAVWWVTHGSAE